MVADCWGRKITLEYPELLSRNLDLQYSNLVISLTLIGILSKHSFYSEEWQLGFISISHIESS
jgi:hypothetical protein